MSASDHLTQEQQDFLEMLSLHRGFLRYTLRGLSDEQARERTTVSELCLGGLIKHVTTAEEHWIDFIERGPVVFGPFDEAAIREHAEGFQMIEGESLAGLLDRYDEVARRTALVVQSLPSLDIAHPVPDAPWFEPGTQWSARRVLTHVIAETAQHAGHADIIRESLDGAKTMG